MIGDVLGWWPGDAPDQIVFGYPIKEWGRAGKVAQYIGGLSALIDVIGPRALMQMSEKVPHWHERIWDPSLFRYQYRNLFALACVLISWAVVTILTFSTARPQAGFWTLLGSSILGCLLVTFPVFSVAFFILAIFEITIYRGLKLAAAISASPLNFKIVGFVLVTLGFAVDLLAS